MKYKTYIVPIISLLAVVAFIWIFTKVVIYLLISAVLALLCRPIVKALSKLRIGKYDLPDAVVSFVSIVSVIGFFTLIFSLFLPVLIKEIKFLSTLNFTDVFTDIISQFPRIKELLLNFGTERELTSAITMQVNDSLNFRNISSLLNGIVSTTGSMLGGSLAVLFITFFLLKDNKMLFKSILLVTPTSFEQEMKDILRNTQSLLSKYFIGLSIDVLIVSLVVTGCMWMLGIKNAVLIGVFTGLMNIIPYMGPLISMVFAMLLGVTGCIEYGHLREISDVITKIFFVLLGVNLVDGILIQPYIFSNSVKAHPLEIFLVILMASSVAGIWGMVIAIPTYTLIRIVAKEFLVNFKFFKKITENIPE
jgi:predicted PurR-regulated permease PerM